MAKRLWKIEIDIGQFKQPTEVLLDVTQKHMLWTWTTVFGDSKKQKVTVKPAGVLKTDFLDFLHNLVMLHLCKNAFYWKTALQKSRKKSLQSPAQFLHFQLLNQRFKREETQDVQHFSSFLPGLLQRGKILCSFHRATQSSQFKYHKSLRL